MRLVFLFALLMPLAARGQDKPTADKPVLRVDAASIVKHPFDYLNAQKPIDLYGAVADDKALAADVRQVAYFPVGDFFATPIMLTLTDEQFRLLEKKQRLFIRINACDGRHINATALGNRVDFEGMEMRPKFSWSKD